MIKKITSLASVLDKKRLTARIFATDRIKANNKRLFYIVEKINKAIEEGKQISFKYCEMDFNRKEVEKNNGETYVNSPYAMIWNDDRYYMMGWSEKHNKVVTFRIDRMKMPKIMDEDAVQVPNGFNAAEHANKTFLMFDGEPQQVVLECDQKFMKVLVDKFGENFDVEVISGGRIRATVELEVSKTFFGWLFTYAGEIDLIGPKCVKEQFLQKNKLVSDTMWRIKNCH